MTIPKLYSSPSELLEEAVLRLGGFLPAFLWLELLASAARERYELDLVELSNKTSIPVASWQKGARALVEKGVAIEPSGMLLRIKGLSVGELKHFERYNLILVLGLSEVFSRSSIKSYSSRAHARLKKGGDISSNDNFDEFWRLYDKKVGRQQCVKLWARLSAEDRLKAIGHVPSYVEATPDKQYRKNPETYLRHRSWDDEVVAKAASVHEERMVI